MRNYAKPIPGIIFSALIAKNIINNVSYISSNLQYLTPNIKLFNGCNNFFQTDNLLGVIAGSQIFIEDINGHSNLMNIIGKSAVGLFCYIPSVLTYCLTENLLGAQDYLLRETLSVVAGFSAGAVSYYVVKHHLSTPINKICNFVDDHIINNLHNAINGISDAILGSSGTTFNR